MVKFGRHVDFFVANELDSARRLYVVPYKEVQHKTCIELHKPPPPPPATPAAVSALASPAFTPPLQNGSRAETPLHEGQSEPELRQMEKRAEPPQSKSTAGLTALFGGDDDVVSSPTASDVKHTSHLDIADMVDDVPAVTASAVTLNAGTGAELAAAVKNLLIAGRKPTGTAQVIPDDYGYDDPCNDNVPDANNLATEQDREAQAHFFAQRFRTEWRICLKRASADFDRAMQLFWSEVFEGIMSFGQGDGSDDDDDDDEDDDDEKHNDFEEAVRGALPDAALQMYVQAVPSSRAQETFSFLKDIHATALINAEALRKLVKKFDKMHYKLDRHSYLLSAKLLPEVYASNFTGSLASLEAGLALLRHLLSIDEDDASLTESLAGSPSKEDTETPKSVRDENRRLRKLATMDEDLRDVAVLSGGYFGNKKDMDAENVERRKKELQWLRGMVESIDPIYIPFLVAHRGFHSIHDRSDVRPLENSLMAYEAAWTNGLHLCECDIALTKDERIILAHDENFARLGMDPTSPLCNRTVRDLTFKELINCPLKSGARPPLLFDVLRSAAAIGGNAKMIVEIKAGNTEAGPALARMFVRHPQLMEHVAVVMSFDAFIMHSLRKEMAAVFEALYNAKQKEQHQNLIEPAGPGHAHTTSAPIQIPTEANAGQEGFHPLKGPVISNIALGSTLSSSPLPTPSMISHHRKPSHGRVPSVMGMGGHNRLDSRDMFGLGMQLMDPKADMGSVGLGLNLAETDNTMSQSSTFLPIHKVHSNLQHFSSHEEKKDPSPADDIAQSFPKLLLITVAETPKADYELFVDITKPEKVAKLDGWLRGGDGGTLDGVYMQYQKSMLGPEGSKAMRNLASRYDVGIWGANPVPDDWDTFHSLVTECHVSYVNSSLPKHFRRKMKRSMSANTLAMNGILLGQSGHFERGQMESGEGKQM